MIHDALFTKSTNFTDVYASKQSCQNFMALDNFHMKDCSLLLWSIGNTSFVTSLSAVWMTSPLILEPVMPLKHLGPENLFLLCHLK
jgi:hypothetical protein